MGMSIALGKEKIAFIMRSYDLDWSSLFLVVAQSHILLVNFIEIIIILVILIFIAIVIIPIVLQC